MRLCPLWVMWVSCEGGDRSTATDDPPTAPDDDSPPIPSAFGRAGDLAHRPVGPTRAPPGHPRNTKEEELR